jgi:hypothetical protein
MIPRWVIEQDNSKNAFELLILTWKPLNYNNFWGANAASKFFGKLNVRPKLLGSTLHGTTTFLKYNKISKHV